MLLLRVVERLGAGRWSVVAQHIAGRSGKSCRLRWCAGPRGGGAHGLVHAYGRRWSGARPPRAAGGLGAAHVRATRAELSAAQTERHPALPRPLRHNHLSPAVKRTAFTDYEDAVVLKVRRAAAAAQITGSAAAGPRAAPAPAAWACALDARGPAGVPARHHVVGARPGCRRAALALPGAGWVPTPVAPSRRPTPPPRQAHELYGNRWSSERAPR